MGAVHVVIAGIAHTLRLKRVELAISGRYLVKVLCLQRSRSWIEKKFRVYARRIFDLGHTSAVLGVKCHFATTHLTTGSYRVHNKIKFT